MPDSLSVAEEPPKCCQRVDEKKKTVNWSEITGNILSAFAKWILTSFVNSDVRRSTFLPTTLRTFETGSVKRNV